MLPPEITQLIGKIGEPVVREVEKGAIKKLADAIGDTNPLYWDEEYAKKSRYGSIIAPPCFFGWPVKWAGSVTFFYMPQFAELYQEWMDIMTKAGYPRRLGGGNEFEFFQPVRAGDILTSTLKIADITEREGKSGKLIFTTFEVPYVNQNGEMVTKLRNTMICR